MCETCSTEEQIYYSFPLIFCKQCGAEFFGVKQTDEGHLSPGYYNPFVSGNKISIWEHSLFLLKI